MFLQQNRNSADTILKNCNLNLCKQQRGREKEFYGVLEKMKTGIPDIKSLSLPDYAYYGTRRESFHINNQERFRTDTRHNGGKSQYDNKVERLPLRAVRNLAESIILQAIEDLWDSKSKERRSSFAFFLGKGFSLCSGIADISVSDRRMLLTRLIRTRRSLKLCQ
jgi:hypothetical protein